MSKVKPSEKSAALDEMLERVFGFSREEVILIPRCAPRPIGCGKAVDTSGYSEIELREYKISALCAECQKDFFV